MKKNLIYVGLVIIIIIICLISVVGIKFKMTEDDSVNQIESSNYVDEHIDNVTVRYNNGIKYYIKTNEYTGSYDYQNIDFSDYYQNQKEAENKINAFNKHGIYSYDEYEKFCKSWNLNQKYNMKDKKYMIISYASYGSPIAEAEVVNAVEKEGKITVYLWENVSGDSANISGYFIAIPLENDTYQNEIVSTLTNEEYDKISLDNLVPYSEVKKPLIYVYPLKKTNVTIKLGNPNLLTTSYPKYNTSWNVIASPNGNLKDTKTNRNYYGLYYESKKAGLSMKDDGFIVKAGDTSKFLEEKLDILGLNEKEANEFIIYWLPILESNEYNYIRFETEEEIFDYMPLYINPKPDTLIRVIMDYKPLNKNIKIKEQKLIEKERSGYTVVEWGANEIK